MPPFRIVHTLALTVSVFAAAVQFNIATSAPTEEPETWVPEQITLRPEGRFFYEPFNQPYCQCINPSKRALARFPNRRNQFAKEAEKEFREFTKPRPNRNIIDSRCSDKIGTLLCFFYFPLSTADQNFKLEVLPCRELCEEVRRDCEGLFRDNGYPWPDPLNCREDYFHPWSSGEICINGTDPVQGYDACMEATVEPPNPTMEDEEREGNGTMSGGGKKEPDSTVSCNGGGSHSEECMTDPLDTEPTTTEVAATANTSTPTVTPSNPSADSATPSTDVTTNLPVAAEPACDPSQCPGCSKLRTKCSGGTFVRNSYTWAAHVKVHRITAVNGNRAYLVHVMRQYLPDPEQAEEMEGFTVIQTTNPECCGHCPSDIAVKGEYLFAGHHDTDTWIWELDVKHRGSLISPWTPKYSRNLANWIARRS